jgi:hypothetical protein
MHQAGCTSGGIRKLLRAADVSVEDVRAYQRIADHVVPELQCLRPDLVVMLDRSARLFSHLLRERWRRLEGPEAVPAFRFINIGREKLRTGPVGARVPRDNDSYAAQAAEQLQRFGDPMLGGGRKVLRVLVLTEFANTGESTLLARDVLQGAFPNAEVSMGAFAATSRARRAVRFAFPPLDGDPPYKHKMLGLPTVYAAENDLFITSAVAQLNGLRRDGPMTEPLEKQRVEALTQLARYGAAVAVMKVIGRQAAADGEDRMSALRSAPKQG